MVPASCTDLGEYSLLILVAISGFPFSSNPVVIWAGQHRARFTRIRDSFWSKPEIT